MQNAKSIDGKYLFDTNEWLTSTQVRSYFSRIRLSYTKGNAISSSSGISKDIFSPTNEDEQEDEHSDEEDDAEVNKNLFI